METEHPTRIEPARLEEPTGPIADVLIELSAKAATLGKALHPRTAANLANAVRMMNTYYSNLIEGHETLPREIERAVAGELDQDEGRRKLQAEALAHLRVQAELDRLLAEGKCPAPASADFIKWLHREFYRAAPQAALLFKSKTRQVRMVPGEWRYLPEHDVSVGRQIPPSSVSVSGFMEHFESRYRFDELGAAGRIMAIAAAHHRFNYIHPFLDGNGRVSRLMSHAMAGLAGIGAHGLWSITRGLARGLEARGEYQAKMDEADTPRMSEPSGRGHLSKEALQDFVLWFLRICLDQVEFMGGLFDLKTLSTRLRRWVDTRSELDPVATRLLEEALLRGEFPRGEAERITGIPERSARRLLAKLTDLGMLASDTPKGNVSLRFPAHALEDLFPKLYPRV